MWQKGTFQDSLPQRGLNCEHAVKMHNRVFSAVPKLGLWVGNFCLQLYAKNGAPSSSRQDLPGSHRLGAMLWCPDQHSGVVRLFPRTVGVRGENNKTSGRVRVRIKSRKASSNRAGIRIGVRESARKALANFRASRRSVLTRSVASRGTSPGAITWQATPGSSRRRVISNPVGRAS